MRANKVQWETTNINEVYTKNSFELFELV